MSQYTEHLGRIRDNIEPVVAIDDAMMMLVSALAGSAAGRVYGDGGSSLEVAAFMIPSLVGLWFVIMLWKAVIAAEKEEGTDQ